MHIIFERLVLSLLLVFVSITSFGMVNAQVIEVDDDTALVEPQPVEQPEQALPFEEEQVYEE